MSEGWNVIKGQIAVAMALVCSLALAIAPLGAVTTRSDSRAYELGVVDIGFGSATDDHQCNFPLGEKPNGGCFLIQPAETSVSISVNDANVEQVGTRWQLLEFSVNAQDPWTQVALGSWCGSDTPLILPIDPGSTHLAVSLDFFYGRDRCPERIPGDQGLLHPGTWGTIDVTFIAP